MCFRHVMRIVPTSNYRKGSQKICFLAHTENVIQRKRRLHPRLPASWATARDYEMLLKTRNRTCQGVRACWGAQASQEATPVQSIPSSAQVLGHGEMCPSCQLPAEVYPCGLATPHTWNLPHCSPTASKTAKLISEVTMSLHWPVSAHCPSCWLRCLSQADCGSLNARTRKNPAPSHITQHLTQS